MELANIPPIPQEPGAANPAEYEAAVVVPVFENIFDTIVYTSSALLTQGRDVKGLRRAANSVVRRWDVQTSVSQGTQQWLAYYVTADARRWFSLAESANSSFIMEAHSRGALNTTRTVALDRVNGSSFRFITAAMSPFGSTLVMFVNIRPGAPTNQAIIKIKQRTGIREEVVFLDQTSAVSTASVVASEQGRVSCVFETNPNECYWLTFPPGNTSEPTFWIRNEALPARQRRRLQAYAGETLFAVAPTAGATAGATVQMLTANNNVLQNVFTVPSNAVVVNLSAAVDSAGRNEVCLTLELTVENNVKVRSLLILREAGGLRPVATTSGFSMGTFTHDGERVFGRVAASLTTATVARLVASSFFAGDIAFDPVMFSVPGCVVTRRLCQCARCVRGRSRRWVLSRQPTGNAQRVLTAF